jgi:transposase-like protein
VKSGAGAVPVARRRGPRHRRSRATVADAVRLAAQGVSTAQIATDLGVHRGTVWAWLSTPEAAADLADTKRAATEGVTMRLRELTHDALDVLADLMRDDAVPHAVRVKAACELLDRAGVTSATPRVNVDVADHRKVGVDVAPLLRQLVRQGRDDDHDHGWP